jgi:hypothetical protein
MYTMEYYLVIRRMKLYYLQENMEMEITLSKIIWTQIDKHHDFAHIPSLDLKPSKQKA